MSTPHSDPIQSAIEQAWAEALPLVAAVQSEASTSTSGSFITIIENPRDTLPWRYIDPDTGQKFDTEFELRLIPDDTNTIFRKRHTRTEWKNGQRREEVNGDGYGDDLIDYAIVGWQGMYAVNREGQRSEIPCERKYKVMLPEKIKAEVIRLCLGKELGQAISGK